MPSVAYDTILIKTHELSFIWVAVETQCFLLPVQVYTEDIPPGQVHSQAALDDLRSLHQ